MRHARPIAPIPRAHIACISQSASVVATNCCVANTANGFQITGTSGVAGNSVTVSTTCRMIGKASATGNFVSTFARLRGAGATRSGFERGGGARRAAGILRFGTRLSFVFIVKSFGGGEVRESGNLAPCSDCMTHRSCSPASLTRPSRDARLSWCRYVMAPRRPHIGHVASARTRSSPASMPSAICRCTIGKRACDGARDAIEPQPNGEVARIVPRRATVGRIGMGGRRSSLPCHSGWLLCEQRPGSARSPSNLQTLRLWLLHRRFALGAAALTFELLCWLRS